MIEVTVKSTNGEQVTFNLDTLASASMYETTVRLNFKEGSQEIRFDNAREARSFMNVLDGA